ncbi:hypothetical protein [Pedobacter rhodius]|uniref:PA14 domain-containing protein n=1 Tax=Pedobacter rhodius TaxID=3004098 RepID=A0ABT4KUA6_9SPHI|nr:hypothetical protein [Pedobacter sp. SJ11]MCZ4222506.1 hypothetical protein [Pedobacter sp. SJ11]
MNKLFTRTKTRRIATLLLLTWGFNLFLPLGTFALTSGPSQPEAQSFQPAGVSDMVDIFSGDFKYNIPLMDVDGYPINLNYQSGVGMDDEASWVGLGWNLNVGGINRQLRGMPDDFAGDEIETEHYVKPKVTVGGKINAKAEIGGRFTGSGSLTFGIFSDNYTGIGAEIGANAGMSFSLVNDNMLTAGMGIGVNSNTASGVDVSPNVSLSLSENSKGKATSLAGLSASLGYNSRSGLKTLNFGASYKNYNISAPIVSFNTEPVMPKVQIPYKTNYESFSFNAGVAAYGFYFSGGGTGYKTVRSVKNPLMKNPGYGFLYAELGKNKPDAVMDFIREKENPVIPELPNLAIPVHTPDIFTYNSQNGSGQFRLYRGGTGSFFDNETSDENGVLTAGYDVGFGKYFHSGVTFFKQTTKSIGRKWTANNGYLQNGDFQNEDLSNPRRQHVFFRKADEKNIEDASLSNKLLSNSLLRISTSGKTANTAFLNQTSVSSNISPIYDKIEKNTRQVQTTAISYLTAGEASLGGLDKTIKTYPFNQEGSFKPAAGHSLGYQAGESRVSDKRKKHHISEITVNNENGQRSVYGMPVYNLKHEEYSFAVGSGYQSQDGLVSMGTGGIVKYKGIDHYYHKESQSPYAYSYLLTGLLSPDYVDKTGDGISADDNGTAIKFNYSKISDYHWRTPYQQKFNGEVKNTAALNRAMLADPDDDKASIIFGKKEICYVHTIESKTKIAYFITTDRRDALGVRDLKGTPDTDNRQKCLKEIRLYSKADTIKPIKVVKFNYSYELCPNVPNGMDAGQGKLTLTSVWFEYGLTHKGANHPYVFNYNAAQTNTNIAYANMMTDRWGSYKTAAGNPGNLTNEEYPYSEQNKTIADANAGAWLLQSITLPSGGKIEVNYEADDYAYVQDKSAMEMVHFDMVGSNNLVGTSTIRVKINELPAAGEDVTRWFKRNYLNESDYLYTKSYVKVSTSNAPSGGKDHDFVPVYCKVNSVQIRNDSALVKFETVNEANVITNPIRSAAWQRIKNEYPRYAYPGFQNRIGDNTGGSVRTVVSAIVSAAGNLAELKQNFYQKANKRGYASEIDLSKSFAKITKRTGFKIGGGTRVKKISINDNWHGFTGNDVPDGTYGQSYDYTTLVDGKKISSGVATYEPSVGNDENPLKQPVPYIQRIKGAINNYFELEAPFAESFYPAPSVGYSKVTVRDLQADGGVTEFPKTGFVTNEFYTAKDFPVRVRVSDMNRYNPKPSNQYSLIRTQTVEEMVLSQGYSIELNDMHGKPKANRIFNQSGAEISSTEYKYQVEKPDATELKLNNLVQVVDVSGAVSPKVVGRDIEFFTDFREQETTNLGTTVNFGLDVISIGFIPIPIPHLPSGNNNEYKLFRSACAMKVTTTTGILSKVIKRENGSTIEVENIAYDGLTGEALITRTQNEFNQDYYTVNIPAYWAYRKMGGAYQNEGAILRNVNLNSFYEVNESYWTLLTQGDELVNLGTGLRYWVVDNRQEIDGQTGIESGKILIDIHGSRLSSITGAAINHQFKLIRSGYRNQLTAGIQSITCMNNPIRSGKLSLADAVALGNLKVISASSTTYGDEWPVDGTGQNSSVVENTSRVFTFKNGPSNAAYGALQTRLYNFCEGEISSDYCGEPYYYFNNPVLNTRLNQVGVWLNEPNVNNIGEPIGFKASFTVPESKIYYFGYAGDDFFNMKVDGVSVDVENHLYYWQLHPVYLTAGTHEVEIGGYNNILDDNSDTNNPASIALEIYNNSLESLVHVNSAANLQILFSTRTAILNPELQSFRTINGIKTWRFGNENFFNPFVNGFKGNWRVASQNVYQENRQYDNIFAAGKKGINVSNSGFLKTFMSYYIKKSSTEWGVNLQSSTWIATNRVTQYDKYGQEAENKDALDRYSAASFDFAGQMPAAVASNAMRREIYANSFEDVLRMNSVPDTNATKEFTLANGSPLISARTRIVSHSGNYALLIPSTGIKIQTIKHTQQQQTSTYLGRSNKNEFTLLPGTGLYPRGFEPKTGGKYILSVWIKDNQPLNRNVNINASSAGNAISLTCKAVVEGWKLLEGTINIPGGVAGSYSLNISPSIGSNIYLDDIRIHPYDAHMKSYAYDERNYRLMAELDENAFATFYEYDDEGSLVRVKKETERGIVTIKENRSSYRKGVNTTTSL